MSDDHLLSIATTLSDYRSGEISPITAQDVDAWVHQFETDARHVILHEMDRILKRYYVSKKKARHFIACMLRNKHIFGADPLNTIRKTQFLEIQRKGTSQRDLLALVDERLRKTYKFQRVTLRDPEQYVYLDDCLYSGNTAYYDIVNWLPSAISGTRLYVVFWAIHIEGLRYFKQRIHSLARERGVDMVVLSLPENEFRNSVCAPEDYDCLWPQELAGNNDVDEIVEYVQEAATEKGWSCRLFRPPLTSTEEAIFSSREARYIVEQAFLKAGAYICTLPAERNANMRPMGYEVLESLGFGAVFVTYRNMSNNCPLALWCGDPSYDRSHPFSKWRPLIPRKPNAPSSFVVTQRKLDADEIPF